jgi:hypothetical protein
MMADAMVEIIPGDTGLFRNVVPKATEDLARNIQRELWKRKDRPSTLRKPRPFYHLLLPKVRPF